jgi:hypothetical protein
MGSVGSQRAQLRIRGYHGRALEIQEVRFSAYTLQLSRVLSTLNRKLISY